MARNLWAAAIATGLVLTTALSGATPAVAAGSPRLTGAHPCAGEPDFTCATLAVPIDHTGRVPGGIDLQVATENDVDAPRGVLLFLTGGPGQPGVPFADRLTDERLPELAKDYRFVFVDQRGTGEFGALNCPELQAQVGSSDIAVPTVDAVTRCAGLLGATAPLYSTDQTVADLDQLRQALGVPKMVVDGVSYGTFVAERYALAHPGHVGRLVLDSVVPHLATSADSLYLAGLRAQGRVLRAACASPACGFDPAADLAALVRQRTSADGVTLFDMLVTYEFVDPTYRNPNPPGFPPGSGDVIGAIHAARAGDPTRLNTLLRFLASGGDPVDEFSSGLHAATLCADMRFAWGNAATPQPLRQAALDVVRKTLPTDQVWPYTPAVAVSQGFDQTCLHWPAERPGSDTGARLPNVPVLIVNGDHDLSTPLEWARQEAATARDVTFVVVPGASHSIQNRELGHAGRDAVIAFLQR
ncbi:MAG TPA: alpha/beta fold hydrolase [Pseudonocardiaceae bacterium]|jgi:pimeloyl-ACP methyl ester carboxylesterase|nr:alpha/beta fold hydrolase [Pseudonocardiaceae bacterium]